MADRRGQGQRLRRADRERMKEFLREGVRAGEADDPYALRDELERALGIEVTAHTVKYHLRRIRPHVEEGAPAEAPGAAEGTDEADAGRDSPPAPDAEPEPEPEPRPESDPEPEPDDRNARFRALEARARRAEIELNRLEAPPAPIDPDRRHLTYHRCRDGEWWMDETEDDRVDVRVAMTVPRRAATAFARVLLEHAIDR